MSETDVVAEIKTYLESRGVLVLRMHVDGIRLGSGGRRKNPLKGIPDLLCVPMGKLGQLFTIEVKKGKNKPSKEQIVMMAKLAARGVPTLVAYSLEDIKKRFE